MTRGTGLLDRAITYGSAASDVTPALLPCPTPCRGWNLEMLLRHACESLTADPIQSSRDVRVRVGVYPAGDSAFLHDGQRHPFLRLRDGTLPLAVSARIASTAPSRPLGERRKSATCGHSGPQETPCGTMAVPGRCAGRTSSGPVSFGGCPDLYR
jgi:hypothetical protein